jgi:peptidoglycan/LPS O-acetylase OafA/YrhL
LVLAVVLVVGDVDISGTSAIFWGPWIGLETSLWLLAFAGIGRKSLNFSNRTLEYANEGSYPFYILHQTVIVVLALGIIDMGVPWILKYLLLATVSLLLTLSVYEALIRRWRPVRFLYGMRPLPVPAVVVVGEPAS